jgi:hypothetical protein
MDKRRKAEWGKTSRLLIRRVTPAEAGVQVHVTIPANKPWIPVFTGMAEWGSTCFFHK